MYQKKVNLASLVYKIRRSLVYTKDEVKKLLSFFLNKKTQVYSFLQTFVVWFGYKKFFLNKYACFDMFMTCMFLALLEETAEHLWGVSVNGSNVTFCLQNWLKRTGCYGSRGRVRSVWTLRWGWCSCPVDTYVVVGRVPPRLDSVQYVGHTFRAKCTCLIHRKCVYPWFITFDTYCKLRLSLYLYKNVFQLSSFKILFH